MSFTSVDLPEPETPVTTVSRPSGRVEVDIFQIVCASQPSDVNDFAVGRAALGGNGDGQRRR